MHTINRDDQDILLAQYTGPLASWSWYANATLHYKLLMQQSQNVVLPSKFPSQRYQNFVIIQPVKYKIQNSAQMLSLSPLLHKLSIFLHLTFFTSQRCTLLQAHCYEKDKRALHQNIQNCKYSAPPPCNKYSAFHYARGVHSFQKSESHAKILGNRKVI